MDDASRCGWSSRGGCGAAGARAQGGGDRTADDSAGDRAPHCAATTIYTWVGDVTRFPHAKTLAAYAGLVPTVRPSGGLVLVGGITKQGAPALRSTVVWPPMCS